MTILADQATSSEMPERLTVRQIKKIADRARHAERIGQDAAARSDYIAARKAIDKALLLYNQLNDVRSHARCVFSLSNIASYSEDYQTARRGYERARVIYQKMGDWPGEADCLTRLGDVAIKLSDNDAAQEAFDQACSVYDRNKDHGGHAFALVGLADVALQRSDNNAARQMLEEAQFHYFQASLPLAGGDTKDSFETSAAVCAFRIGQIALDQSEEETAKKSFDRARGILRRVLTGYKNTDGVYRKITRTRTDIAANCAFHLGEIARRRSEDDTARQAFEEARLLYQKTENVLGAANCVYCLARIAWRRSDDDQARQAFTEAQLLYRKAKSTLGENNCIDALTFLKRKSQKSTLAKSADYSIIIPFPVVKTKISDYSAESIPSFKAAAQQRLRMEEDYSQNLAAERAEAIKAAADLLLKVYPADEVRKALISLAASVGDEITEHAYSGAHPPALMADKTLIRLQRRYEERLGSIKLPPIELATKEDAQSAGRLAATYRDLCKRQLDRGLAPEPKPELVAEAERFVETFYRRSRLKPSNPSAGRRPRRVVALG